MLWTSALLSDPHADRIGNLSISRSFAPTAEDLCLACGMCCNGGIFADVQLQVGDELRRLRSLGLRLAPATDAPANTKSGAPAVAPVQPMKFCQPCAAFDGSRCRIYGYRPRHCREFECLLLKRFQEGRTSAPAALRNIRKAKRYSERVKTLLRQLGDTEETLPLARRFERTRDRLETIGMEAGVAAVYADLTLAVFDLNFLISGVFYPG